MRITPRFSDAQVDRALDHAERLAEQKGHKVGKWSKVSPGTTLNQYQCECARCGRTMFWTGYGMTGTALKEDCIQKEASGEYPEAK